MVEFECLLCYRQVRLTSSSRAHHNSQKSSVNYDWTTTNTSQFSEIINAMIGLLAKNFYLGWLNVDWTGSLPIERHFEDHHALIQKNVTNDNCNSLAVFIKARKIRILSLSHPIEDILHDDLCDKKKVSLKPATSTKNNEIGNFMILLQCHFLML